MTDVPSVPADHGRCPECDEVNRPGEEVSGEEVSGERLVALDPAVFKALDEQVW